MTKLLKEFGSKVWSLPWDGPFIVLDLSKIARGKEREIEHYATQSLRDERAWQWTQEQAE